MAHDKEASVANHLLYRTGVALFIAGIILSLVDGALPRLFQVFTADGFNSFLGPRYILMLSVLFLLPSAELAPLIKIRPDDLVLVLGSVVMLLGCGFLNGFGESAASFYHYFVFLLFVPFAALVNVKLKNITFALLCTALPIVLLGVLQGVTDSPLINTGSVGDKFAVIAFVFFENIRAFSLFSSSALFGYFLVLILSISFHMFLYKRDAVDRIPALILVIMSVCGVYFCRTRSVYIMASYVLCLLSWQRVFSTKLGRTFYVGQFFSFLVMAGTIFLATIKFDSADAASSSVERVGNWMRVFESYSQADLLHRIFGLAMRQTDDAIYTESVLIDNAYVASFAAFGCLGLVFYLAVFVKMSRRIYAEAERRRGVVPYAVAFSTWAAGGVSANYFMFPVIVYLLFYMSSNKSSN